METITIKKGSTHRESLIWLSENDIFFTVQATMMSAPPTLTVPGHTLVNDQYIKLECVKPGSHPLNGWEGIVSVVDANTIILPGVNAHCYPNVEGECVIRTGEVKDLTGFIARMQIRDKHGNLLLELTSANGGIDIDNVSKKITVLFTAEQTASFPGHYGLFDLEMESANNEVTTLLQGVVVAQTEVTK